MKRWGRSEMRRRDRNLWRIFQRLLGIYRDALRLRDSCSGKQDRQQSFASVESHALTNACEAIERTLHGLFWDSYPLRPNTDNASPRGRPRTSDHRLLILALALRAVGVRPTSSPNGLFATVARVLHPRPTHPNQISHALLMRAIRNPETGRTPEANLAVLGRLFPKSIYATTHGDADLIE